MWKYASIFVLDIGCPSECPPKFGGHLDRLRDPMHAILPQVRKPWFKTQGFEAAIVCLPDWWRKGYLGFHYEERTKGFWPREFHPPSLVGKSHGWSLALSTMRHIESKRDWKDVLKLFTTFVFQFRTIRYWTKGEHEPIPRAQGPWAYFTKQRWQKTEGLNTAAAIMTVKGQSHN